MEVDIYSIFDDIVKNSDNNSELVTNANNLLYDLKGSKLESILDTLISTYCDTHNICEECGATLETIEHREPTEEYFGFPTNQITYEQICTSCD